MRVYSIITQKFVQYYMQPYQYHADPDYAQNVVSELDSELNKFISTIPDHCTSAICSYQPVSYLTLFRPVRWNPQQENYIYRNQSALLYASYYTVQITVHRSFVPLPRRPSPISFPSLAICTNAARSCIRILEKHSQLGSSLFLHWHQVSFRFSSKVSS